MSQSTLTASASAIAPAPSLRRALAGAGLALFAGIQIDGAVITSAYTSQTAVSTHRFSYPWSGATAYATEITWGLSGILLLAALIYFAWTTGSRLSRSGQIGSQVAVAGAAMFLVAYTFSVLARHARTSDPVAVAAIVCFALATVLTAAGLVTAGSALLRSAAWTSWRWTPLALGGWLVAMIPLQMAPVLLPASVGVFGLLCAALGVAILVEPRT